VFDGPVFPRRVHGLEDEQHAPAILGVEPVLKGAERLHPHRQRLLGAALVLGLQMADVPGIDIVQAELLSVLDTVRPSQHPGPFHDLVQLHGLVSGLRESRRRPCAIPR
jgi:hypothetical protein